MAETFLKKIADFPADVKLPPQLKVIMDALATKEHGAEVKALGAEVLEALKTRQDPVRVIMFYVPFMKTHNVVEVTKIGDKASKVDADGQPVVKAPKKAKKAAVQTEDVVAA